MHEKHIKLPYIKLSFIHEIIKIKLFHSHKISYNRTRNGEITII